MGRQFQGLIIKQIAAPPQVVIIDGNPYMLVVRAVPGLQGTLNVEAGLAQIPEATQDMIEAQQGPSVQQLPDPDWSQLMPPANS